jgi:hypothetical protein
LPNRVKLHTNGPQQRKGRITNRPKLKGIASPKKELRIGYSSIKPSIEFSDADWGKIESAGGKALSAEHRDRLRILSYSFVEGYSAAENAIGAGLIAEQIHSIIESAEVLKRALQISSRFATLDDWVAMMINKKLLGDDFGRSHVPPVWHALTEVVRAAKATLPELMSLTVATQPGPKHGRAKDQLVRDMKLVFEDAGGKATIGTRRKDGKEELGSAFADFVRAVVSVIARTPENKIPPEEVGTIGNAMRKVLRGEKSIL